MPASLPLNPFLSDDGMAAIGRNREVAWLIRRLRQAASVSLVGWPRIGKTTVLKLLAKREAELDGLAIVYLDCKELPSDAGPPEFWRQVLLGSPYYRSISSEIERLERQHYDQITLHSVLQRACATAQIRLVVLIDHAEYLAKHPGLRSMQLHVGLRALSNDMDAPLRLILATKLDLAELNAASQHLGGSPIFNHLEERQLGLMSDEEIRELIACRQNRIDRCLLPAEDIERTIEQAGGHPQFALTVASVLFDLRSSGLGVVDIYASAQKRLKYLIMGEMEALFANLRPTQQMALHALARGCLAKPTHDLNRLVELGLLRIENGAYRVRSVLVNLWLSRQTSHRSQSESYQVTLPPLVYIIFANKDRRYRNQIATFLHRLVNSGQIRTWDRDNIDAGTHIADEIESRLPTAALILALQSPDLWFSPECQPELKIALDRWRNRQSRVVPIRVRPDHSHGHPWQQLRPLPSNGRCISEWSNTDSAWSDVLDGLMQIFGSSTDGDSL